MGGKEIKLDQKKVIVFYSRPDIRKAIYLEAKDKEIGMKFTFGYGKRPDVIATPNDVLELAKQGATSFHCSEELWDDPLSISSDLTKKELGKYEKLLACLSS